MTGLYIMIMTCNYMKLYRDGPPPANFKPMLP